MNSTENIRREVARIVAVVNEEFQAKVLPNLTPDISRGMKEINFFWGHPLEIIKQLQEYAKHDCLQFHRFPFVGLYTDISINVGGLDEYDTTNLEMVICNLSKPEWSSAERDLYNFHPVLHPTYNRIIKQFEQSSFFDIDDIPKDMRHTATDRYMWGKSGLYGNTKNMFNDYIDAIHIENLTLKLTQNC